MIKRSLKVYFAGYAFGILFSFFLFTAVPSIYDALLDLLVKKIEVQSSIISDPVIMIGVNNVIASLLCAFGGLGLTRVFIHIGGEGDSESFKFLERLDNRIIGAKNRHYYASLFIFPYTILFFNGLILGFFLILYLGQVEVYLSKLFPHGFFELPGIILSGSIGFGIGEAGVRVLDQISLEDTIKNEAQKRVFQYVLVFLLFVIGAIAEGYPMRTML